MAAIVSGASLGLNNSSLAVLGGQGQLGNAALGASGERVYVNSTTGNLVIQRQDEIVVGAGNDISIVRTYNSQGVLDGDNNDNWRIGVYKRVYNLIGTVNTAGSAITRVDGDASESVYTYNASMAKYVNTDGAEAFDTLQFNATSQVWTWIDGTTRITEEYDASTNGGGRITRSLDPDGNAFVYTYDATGLITRVTDSSGLQTTDLAYTGTNLTKITVTSNGQVSVRTGYDYDTSNRLAQVTTDLSPEDASITDAKTYVVSYTYDGTSKRVKTITQSDGNNLTFDYYADGKLQRYTDAAGRATSFTYTATTATIPAIESANGAALSTVVTTNTSYPVTGSLITPVIGWQPESMRDGLGASAAQTAFDQNGNGMAVWIKGTDVVYSIYNKANDTWSAPSALDGTFAGTVASAHLSMSANGNALVTWAQNNTTSNSIYARRFIAGAWEALSTTPLENLTAAARNPSGAINDAGRAVVAFVQTNGTVDNLYANVYNGTGWQAAATAVDDLPTANGNTIGSAIAPRAAIDAQNNATVVWFQKSGTQTIESPFSSRYTASTSTWSTSAGSTLAAAASSVKFALDASGNGVAVWLQGTSLVARSYTAGAWSAAVNLNSAGTTASTPDISMSATGGYGLATWIEGGNVVARIILNGAWQGTGPTTIESAAGAVAIPAGAINATGDATVVFVQNSGGVNNVYANRRVGGAWATGTLPLLEANANPVTTTLPPSVAIDGQGNINALWLQKNGADATDSVYSARYNATNTTPYYRIPNGASWDSIATALYGSTAPSSQLQSAMGNPSLIPGNKLTGFPPTLTVTTSTTVAPYYTVKNGDTWALITQAVYGTTDANAFAALQSWLGIPGAVPAVGTRLTMPQTLGYTKSVPATRTDMTDPLNLITTTVSDTAGELLEVLAPAIGGVRQSARFTYNANGDVTQVIDERGNAVVYLYDSRGNWTLKRDAAGNTVTRVYDANNQVQNETLYLVPDPDGPGAGQPTGALTTRYVYDGESHLRFLVSAEGRVTEHRYDLPGQRIATLRYAGNTYSVASLTPSDTLSEATLNAWVAAADKTNATLIKHDYDFRGQVKRTTTYARLDAAGAGIDTTKVEADYVYDQAGLLRQTIDARGVATAADLTDYKTVYAYDGLDRLTLATDALNRSTITAYDSAQRKTTVTLANGLARIATYSATGDLLSVLESANSANLGETKYFYDADRGLRRAVDPTGVTTHVLYDEASRKIGEIDGDGSLTEYRYDAAGNLTRTIRYATAVSDVNLASLKDASGNPTNVTLATIRPTATSDDRSTWNTYGAANRLVKSVDELGFVTEQIYDGANRLSKVVGYANAVSTNLLGDAPASTAITPVASGDDRISRNLYDAEGKLAGTLDGQGYLVEYKYDAAGQLVETIGYATVTSAALQANGTLTQLRPALSAADIHSYRRYDAQGRLLREVDGEGYLTEYSYDAAGNRTGETRYAIKTTDRALTLNGALGAYASTPDSPAISVTGDIEFVAKIAPDSWNSGVIQHILTKRTTNNESYGLRLAADGKVVLLKGGATAAAMSSATSNTAPTLVAGQAKWIKGRIDVDNGGGAAVFSFWASDDGLTWTSLGSTTVTGAASPMFDGTNPVEIGSAFGGGDRLFKGKIYYADIRNGIDGPIVAKFDPALDAAGGATASFKSSTGEVWAINGAATIGTLASAQDQSAVYQYDALNRVTSQTAPDGTVTQYTYDEVGNLTTTVKAYGTDPRTLTTQYDKQGRVTKELSAKGASLLPSAVTQADIDAIWTANAVKYTYDAAGRRTSSTDANGKRTLFYYNADGNLTHTINAFGEVHETVYNALGQVKNTIDYGARIDGTTLATLTGGLVNSTLTTAMQPLVNGTDNSSAEYRYNVAGELTLKKDPLANAVTQAFNAFGELKSTSQTIAVGQTLDHTYNYDRRGLLTQTVWDPTGVNSSSSTLYDAFGRAIQSTDARGSVSTKSYDRLGRTVVTTDPLSNQAKVSYDAFDRVLTQTDALGKVTTYSYDTVNRSVTVTTPEGIATTTTANRHGETITIRDGRGNTTSYQYDLNGNLFQVDAPAAGSSVRHYDNANLLIDTVDALNTKTAYTYDAANRVHTRTVDFGSGRLNLVTTYDYDAKGQTILVTDPNNTVTKTEFDAKGQVKSVIVDFGTGRLNLKTSYTYDARGKTLTVTEGDGSTNPKVTRYDYDALGRRTSERVHPNGLNITTTYVYDKNGNVIKKLDALNNATRYFYDADDRLVYTVDALGGVTKNEYDADSRVTRHTAYATPIAPAALSDTSSAATVAGLVVTSTNPTKSDETKSYVYDGDGHEIYCIDALGNVKQKTYDGNGNLVRLMEYSNPIPASTALTQAAVSLAIQPDAINDRLSRTVYDAANRPAYDIDAAGYVTQRVYDNAGNAIRAVRYANALQGSFADNVAPQVVTVAPATGSYVIVDPVNDRVTRSVYDAAGRPIFMIDGASYVTQRVYDNAGNVIKEVRYANALQGSVADNVAPQIVTVAPATGSYVLVDAAADQSAYDAFDGANRRTRHIDAMGFVVDFTYDAAGKVATRTAYTNAVGLPTTPDDRWAYHAPNPLGSASTTRYAYDAAGRLIEETQGFSSADAATTRYVLDALGNRKNVIDPRGVELAETDSDWALATRKTIATEEPALALALLDAAGNAKRFASLTDAQKDGLRARYTTVQQFDELGRKKSITDALGGVTAIQFDAFGNAVKITDPRLNSGYFYFDALNHAVLHVDPEGDATETSYNAFGEVKTTILRATKVTGTLTVTQRPTITADVQHDQTTTTEYDRRGLKLKVTDAEGKVDQYDYSAFGNKKFFINKLSGRTDYTYDRVGNLRTETLPINSLNAAGQSVAVVNQYEYDARGNRTRQIEASGLPEARTTTFEFDKLDREIKKIGEAVHVFNATTNSTTDTATPIEQHKYDGRGNLIETVAANGERTLTYYDARNRKTAEIVQIDATGGALTVWKYNDGDAPISELRYGDPVALPAVADGTAPAPANLANVREKRFVYDANNALLETHVPGVRLGQQLIDGSGFNDFTPMELVTKSRYDAAGNEVQSTDARENPTFRYYDRLGQKIVEVDPENYVTRWDYDAAGNVFRQTRYAYKLSLPPLVTSDPLDLINNVTATSTAHQSDPNFEADRVTQQDYDRMNRVTERRVLGVDYGTVSATGTLTSATGTSLTQIRYNGLGQITQQIDATDAVTDIGYDVAGRKTKEQGAQFTDFEGALVRPTTDYEYDGLNQAKREIERGKVASDDRITTFQYDYGFGARLIGQTDPTGAKVNFAYDLGGKVASRWLLRTDADNNPFTDRVNYSYDLLGRESLRKDLGTSQTNETRYNVFGEITGKRTNGGGVGAAWQETAEYDNLGRAWKTNSGDGVYKVYLYDANGNATLSIESAGPDFSALTLNEVMGLRDDQKFLTISQYDARNQLVGTFEPKMTGLHENLAIGQFITQKAGTVFTVGSVLVGPMRDTVSKPTTTNSEATSGSATTMPNGTLSATVSLEYAYPNPALLGGAFTTYQLGSAAHNLTFTIPDTSALGDGNLLIRFSLASFTGNGNPSLSLAGLNNFQLSVEYGLTSKSFVVGESGSATLFTDLTPAYIRGYSYSLFKLASRDPGAGEIPLGTFSGTTSGAPAVVSNVNQTLRARGTTSSAVTVTQNEVHFRGQGNAARLILQYRLAGSSNGWSVAPVAQKAINGVLQGGWFSFDRSSIAPGTYDFVYTALDGAGAVINSQSGQMTLGAAPSVTAQTAKPYGGAGRAFMDANFKLEILEQGSTAESMVVRYRHAGTAESWITASAAMAAYGGPIKGWFIFDTIGLSGTYEYEIEAKNAAGGVVNKAAGSFTTGNPVVSPLTAYQDLPGMVHFKAQPQNAASLLVSYRPLGSTGAFSDPISVPKALNEAGAFDWNATTLAPDPTRNYDYEYSYQTFDINGLLVNKAHGTFKIGANPTAVAPHTNDNTPSIASFSPPQANATTLILQFRNAGSVGDYSPPVTLTRSNATVPFTWDASAVAPGGTTTRLDYIYQLRDSAGALLLTADLAPVTVRGTLTLGTTSAPAELHEVIIGTSNIDWSVHRQQVHNAFGEVIQEVDGLGRATDFRFNSLGRLVEKQSPDTDVTQANGFVEKNVRPTTRYTYDLAGRLVAVKDPNRNLNVQQLLPGTGLEGDEPSVLTAFQPDPTHSKRVAFDVFGDARRLTDEIGRITQEDYDKLGRLKRIVRPARAANTPGNPTAAAIPAVETYLYDQAGNRISHTNADNKTEKTYYDSLGRVVKSVSFGGATTGYAYVADSTILGVGGKQVGGWVKTVTDPTGKTLQDRQDIFGRVTSHKDLGDRTFTYNYSSAGRLVSQTGNTGQNIVFDYYANGYLKSIDDRGVGSFTQYEYDAEGNRTLEAYSSGPNQENYQYAEVTYDKLNRVVRIEDPRADIHYEYDANGNRRRVWSRYHDGIDGSEQVQDFWYTYDDLNRFVVTMGRLSGSGVRGASATDTTVRIETGTDGVELSYNAASERTAAVYGSDGRREVYIYTADGYLEDTQINGVVRTRRFNDVLGRVINYQDYGEAGLTAPTNGRTSTYDYDNRLLTQNEYKGAIGGQLARSTTYTYLPPPGSPLASTVSNLFDTTGAGQAPTTITSFYDYEWWDSAKEKSITAKPFNPNLPPTWQEGFSYFVYDANGHLKEVDDPNGARSIRFTNDSQGQALIRDEITAGTTNQQTGAVSGGITAKDHRFYYFEGHRVGDVGNDGPLKVSYAEELAQPKDASRQELQKTWQPISSADFDQNFDAINSTYPAPTPSLYTVRGGETLRTIAAAVWGDAALWYIIADANGLSGSVALVAGQTLTIPNKVANIHNNSETFRVYNPGEVLGDVSPTIPDAPLPPPPPPAPRKKKRAFASILAVIVAIVAIVITAGAAAIAMGAVGGTTLGLGTAFSAGLSVLGGGVMVGGVTATATGLLGGATLVASAAIGGAVGSIASQGVSIALGMQDQFSWKQVGMSAIGSAVSAGMASAFAPAATASAVQPTGWQLAGQAALSNVATQGVNMALGYQEKFNWRSVAASAIAAPIARAAGGAIGADAGFARHLASGVAGGVIGYAAQRAVGMNNKIDYTSITANAIGQSLVGELARDPVTEEDAYVGQAMRQEQARQIQETWDRDDAQYGIDVRANEAQGNRAQGLRVDRPAGEGLRYGDYRAAGVVPEDSIGNNGVVLKDWDPDNTGETARGPLHMEGKVLLADLSDELLRGYRDPRGMNRSIVMDGQVTGAETVGRYAGETVDVFKNFGLTITGARSTNRAIDSLTAGDYGAAFWQAATGLGQAGLTVSALGVGSVGRYGATLTAEQLAPPRAAGFTVDSGGTSERILANIAETRAGNANSNFSVFVQSEGRLQESLNILPPNRGQLGPVETVELKVGAVVDRYGSARGSFVSPSGVPFAERSLPSYYESTVPYFQYEVIQPLPGVTQSRTLPWFGQRGTGPQLELPNPVQWYLDNGYLKIKQ